MSDGPHSTRTTPGTESIDPLEVCTLPPAGLSERLAWIRAEILPHARGRETTADGVAIELEDAPGLAEKLDRLVALEADCCSSVGFAHETIADSGRRRLVIRGVDPGAPIFEGLAPKPDASRA